MSFKIGLFSLKTGVGCSSLAIHIANFLASNEKVALIEKFSKGEKPKMHRAKIDINDDGTFVANNVHFYPAQKIINSDVWPLKYEPVDTSIEEDVNVYDFGAINFMFEFPDNMDKLYLVTDTNENNIPLIEAFYRDLATHDNKHEFDLIIVGSSRDAVNKFKEMLPFISSVISVGDKKEPRIDYMFAVKIQVFMRSLGLATPEYHDTWEYDPVTFYSEDEWIKMWRETIQAKDASKKKNGLFGGKKKNKKEDLKSKEPIIVEESEVGTVKRQTTIDANVLEFIEYESVPEPTFVKPESDIDDLKEDESKPRRVMSVRPKPVIEKESKPVNKKEKNDTVVDEKEEIVKAAEAFNPNKAKDDVSGEFKEHIVYEHKAEASGVLGDLIEGINRGGHFCCSVFLVTKLKQLFVFSNINSFFDKLDVVKREIESPENVYYAVLTFNNMDREPNLFTEDKNVTLNVYSKFLKSLDKELHVNSNVNHEKIKEYKELLEFSEVIYVQ